MSNAIEERDYWEKYYSKRREPFGPSPFARYVAERHVTKGESIVELGCGNGRDAVFFAKAEMFATAIDQCADEIRFLKRTYGSTALEFLCEDISCLPESLLPGRSTFDNVYSRFSLHAVSDVGQESILTWASKILGDEGQLLLEFRGRRNELFGRGESSAPSGDTFIYEGHSRRFVDADALANDLEGRGFEVLELDERPGFSPTPTTDETFARLVARRRQTETTCGSPDSCVGG